MGNLDQLYSRLNSAHLPGLDGLRFIAVSLVILSHIGFKNIPAGHGVMLFFVISGFLITWLMLKEKEKTGTMSLKGFYWRRFLRIFPAFYVYCAVAVAMILLNGKEIPMGHLISSVFYFSNYYAAFNPGVESIFSHTWSLAVEEQFYLMFPLLFLLFSKKLRNLKAIICMLLVSAWVWRFVLVYGFGVGHYYIYNAFETRLDHLMIGCLLAVVLRERQHGKIFSVLTASSVMPLLSILALTLSVYYGYQNPVYNRTIGSAIDPVLMAAFIVQCITFSGKGFWNWLDWRFVKYCGAISYSMYLYQPLTTGAVPGWLSNFPVLIHVLATFAATIGLASLSYYIVEKPFLLLKTMSLREVYEYYRSYAVGILKGSFRGNSSSSEAQG